MSRLIERYLAELDDELAFDPGLARRLHAEVSSHFDEALDNGRDEAAAIAGFGNARTIARAYAAAALPARFRATWTIAVALAAVSGAMMRWRTTTLGLIDADGLGAALALLDRAGFAVALLCGGYGWLQIHRQNGVARPQPLMAPIVVGLGALLVSIAASAGRALLVGGAPPIIGVSIAIELAVLAAALARLRLLRRHVRHLTRVDSADVLQRPVFR
jgi:hypothetical protein